MGFIIVDLDQTLCDSTEIIEKYLQKGQEDWKGYYSNLDKCGINGFVNNLLNDRCVIFLTSRRESSREITIEWLKKHYCENINTCKYFCKLFMRPNGDKRPSAVVKKELYEKHIKGKYEIDCVIDDDLSVIQMFKQEGLNCLHVQTSVQYVD